MLFGWQEEMILNGKGENPLSLFKKVIYMDTYFYLDGEKCTNCMLCYNTCKNQFNSLIVIEGIVYLNREDDHFPCHLCQKPYECEKQCPNNAITIERW